MIQHPLATPALLQAPHTLMPCSGSLPASEPYAAQVHASLIVVLTRGGSTARLVAKYRPLVSACGARSRARGQCVCVHDTLCASFYGNACLVHMLCASGSR